LIYYLPLNSFGQWEINIRVTTESQSPVNIKNLWISYGTDSGKEDSEIEPDTLKNLSIARFLGKIGNGGVIFLNTIHSFEYGMFYTKEDIENLYFIDFYVYRKKRFFKKYVYIRTTSVFRPGYKKSSLSIVQKIHARKALWKYWKDA
jgi:hypothetical protein